MKLSKVTEYIKEHKDQGYLKTVSCVVNPNDAGNEEITLSVDVFDNGDFKALKSIKGLFTNTELHLQCYGSHTVQVNFNCFSDLYNAVRKMHDILENNYPGFKG